MLKNIISETYNLDCMLGMQKYPDLFFDLAICDIPYGINLPKMGFLKFKKNHVRQKNGKIYKSRKVHKIPSVNENWDITTPSQLYFDELKRISKNQIIFGIEYTNWSNVGTGRIKWDKCTPEGVGFSKYEIAYCSIFEHTENLKLLHSGMMQAKSLLYPTIPKGNKKLNEQKIHPCQKPILLYKKLIIDYGFEGCNIIDTHFGSGNSRVAAYDMNCNYHGYEINPIYYQESSNHFNKHIAQLEIFIS